MEKMDAGGTVGLLLKAASHIRAASKEESARLEANTENLGVMVPYSQYRLLAALAEEGPLSQRGLAKTLGVKPASVSETVTRLEAKGLAERVPSAHDGRAVEVRLTPKGTMSLTASQAHARGFNERVLSPLDEDEQRELARLLTKLCGALETQTAAGREMAHE